MKYVVIDIGCIECGEPTSVLGIFDDEKTAEKIKIKYEKIQNKNWHGQHKFKVFEIKEENKELYNERKYIEHINW